MTNRKMRVDLGRSAVRVRAGTFNEAERTVEVIWSTGAKVKRYDWGKDGWYMEELSMDPKAIRLGRFQNGMSFLDTHEGWSMASRLGAVVRGSVRIEDGEASATVKLSRNALGEQIFQDLKDEIPVPISVGYRVHKYEKSTGEEGQMPTYRAIDWEPMELSAVPIPADAGAHSRSEPQEAYEVEIVTRGAVENEPKVEENFPMKKRDAAKTFNGTQLDALALGAGLTRQDNESDDQLRERLIKVYDAEDEAASRAAADAERETRAAEDARRDEEQRRAAVGNTAPLTTADVQKIVDEARRAETARVTEIRSLGKRAGLEQTVVDTAVDGGTTVDAFRAAMFDKLVERQGRAQTFPHVETGGMDAQETTRKLVANAIMHRNGMVENLEPGANQWRNMSPVEIARDLLMANGMSGRGDNLEILRRALQSTTDFPIILGDVANQRLLAGYQGYLNTFGLIASRNIVPDLKEVTVLELGNAPDLEDITESGEYTRGTAKESKEGFTIGHYGKVFGLTEAILINDKLGAFMKLIEGWGHKAAKLEGDITWGVIIKNKKLKDNVDLFHANHKNLVPGTALSVANLEVARLKFREQTDIDDELIDIEPKYLFTGTAYEMTAQRITTGAFNATQVADITPQAIRSLVPVYEPRINKLSAKAWFLFADQVSTMGRGLQYALLSGHETPRREQRVGFDYDGIEFRIDHYFGAGLTDYRFGVKNPGD
ncbi:putative Peptidase U35 phage prohead HK97 [uncultured Pleomorphomonas sp.]|uniref:Putative Peptidase U35 phage prohead HK97 n=1 Tax=uncultured Pleomorphomonas sp. TaxID=442121 RepID=A0A212LRC9_9HYPH|nr:prohead protease/major capsid protein fusion protein [uncultured Pleomorphomonas sp.]SCM79959.1 putative Peptidase U35 phage prohead HK97 [uncultured Pleomorphomonas sp.]